MSLLNGDFCHYVVQHQKGKTMIDIKRTEITPICPYCEQEVQELIQVKRGWFAINRVFCCPHCRKIIGMTAGEM